MAGTRQTVERLTALRFVERLNVGSMLGLEAVPKLRWMGIQAGVPFNLGDAAALQFSGIRRKLLTHSGDAHDAKQRSLHGMSHTIKKRSVYIGGRKTSVSLEEPFWTALKEIAKSRSIGLHFLVNEALQDCNQANLSSALRLYVLAQYTSRMPANWRNPVPD